MNFNTEMERDATWMSKDTWAAKHGASNLNLWYEAQYYWLCSQPAKRIRTKPWWDDSDKKGAEA